MDRKDQVAKSDRDEERREFLSKVGKTAVAAPAVTLLVAAGSKRAGAWVGYKPKD